MSERPKILFCMHLPPPVHGASVVGKQIYDSQLIKESFDCVYLNPAASETVDAIGHFSLRKMLAMAQFYRELCKIVRKEKPALVYITPSTHDWGFYRDCVTMWILKCYHSKIVAHFHNKPKMKFTQRCYNKWLYKWFFKNIHAIFLANKLADTFRVYLGEEYIHICPNGMPKKIEKVSRKKSHTPYNFLFVSNMMTEKGVKVLLEACSILRKEGHVFRCEFIGQWSDVTEHCFRQLCETYDILEVVQAHGPKYGDEKDVFFSNADAFVFPTFYHGECLSLVVLEAMQYALPIITTSEGALAEVVDAEVGIIIEKQNVKPLTDQMRFLLEHQDVGCKLGENGRFKYEKEYTLEIFEKHLCSILKECLEK